MGIVLSLVISYAGLHEVVEFFKHIVSGVIPYNHPGYDDLVDYYTRELNKSAKTANNWTTHCGQGYLSLAEDDNGKLSAAAIKYHGAPDSTAILFSTKISSFGDSVEEPPVANGDYRKERYSPSKTKTFASNTSSETFSVANRNKSPGADTQTPANSFDDRELEGQRDQDNKLTWQYTPLNSNPEIHFQSYDDENPGVITEDYLRSLDGIKYRPLQRSDPSGRRRSFRRNRSSSSNSSKESRASRDEELQMFTSLEEAEFEKAVEGGSAPNLSARSFRSRSRERRHENGSVQESDDDVADESKLKEILKSDTFDEQTNGNEVIEEEDDDVDFWGNSSD